MIIIMTMMVMMVVVVMTTMTYDCVTNDGWGDAWSLFFQGMNSYKHKPLDYR